MTPSNVQKSSTSVVIVDGHDVVHAGIESWVTGSHPLIKIVGHFTTPAEFLRRYPAKDAAVDVVLFELSYGGRGPQLDALRRVCDAGHCAVVYSFLVSDEAILASLCAGAVSYVAKDEPGHELAEAIYAARTDAPRVPPRMAQALLNRKRPERPQLSQREQQVLIAWFQTDNKHAVASRLFIEPSTVATHLQRVRRKYAALGRPAPTKAALVARAIQDGILGIDDL